MQILHHSRQWSVQADSHQARMAMLGHPLRSGEMGGIDSVSVRRVLLWIEAKHDFGDLRPIGTFRICIEKTQIELEMCPIVGSEFRIGRRTVRELVLVQTILQHSLLPMIATIVSGIVMVK